MTFSKRSPINHPNWTFWSSFLLLNFLLFLPIYLFFRSEASFWPWTPPLKLGLTAFNLDSIIHRNNLDIFRFNVELLLLILLWMFFKPFQRRWFIYLAFSLYLVQFGYAIYEGFIRSYYLLDPVFYNDFFLFADGARFVLSSLSFSPLFYLGSGLLFLIIAGALFWLHKLLFESIQLKVLTKTTRTMLLGMVIFTLGPVVLLKGEVSLPETAVTSFTAKIAQNIQLSQAAKTEAARFDSQYLTQFYQFTQQDLVDKPNIYLIFLESYGSVLFKRLDFRLAYEKLLQELESQLDANNWSIASTRSNAPTWGGGSWISYTSVLSGLRLDSHAQYLAMFNRYSREPFPHLINYLRSQGYLSYRLSPNSNVLNDIEWHRYKIFYGVDEWLRFNDLQYRGPLFGWGPSPPDQYALNYAHEYINQVTDSPHVFFYITQNSHYPWTPLPEVAPEWQALNDAPSVEPPPTQRLPLPIMRDQYLASIQYELTMLVDFILKEADENDIFVVMGDHQPARVARYADGWDTPMHIISKNSGLIESYYEYGFVPGLNTRFVEPTIHHEGFYTLFMRVLLQQSGLDSGSLPAYRPDGFPLN